MSVELENEIKELYLEMNNDFYKINIFLDSLDFKPNDEYKKINRTYFLISRKHYEAFLVLINYQHYSSTFILARTILENFVKSMYLESIVKPKNGIVNDFIMKENKFPKFYDMAKELESYQHPSGSKFEGFFNQLLKKELATYEKMSYLSHSSGKYLQEFNEKGLVNISKEDVFSLMKFMHKMFISNALFHLLAFEHFDETKLLIKIYEKTLSS
ncbi:hypothetical protein CRU86_09690 [Aliarcobacter skirrowii]|uniref:hypothetical protein n=1 Tax=Aliarcobacter skirrowii TaxID=28200 RepID=UPI00100A6ECD|nr:hypothetical protein [Aliarcobacter skirrowii]RXJ74993.1 hypothetical protein CRU86_09690 [Aliarcobacter skirrowii]